MPFGGGPPIKTFDMPPNIDPMLAVPLRWSPDGEALTYMDGRDDGVSNVWNLPLDGGGPKQLTSFEDKKVFLFDWCHGGEHLVFSRGYEISDAVLFNVLE